ncbi:MAG: hypothetical protein GY795_31260 [Desulfobacterales bacterium]|nr:hypothetical protein [Desulfobacterales bacterium]
MNRILRKGFQTYEIVSWHEIRPDDRFLEFHNTFSALNFLRRLYKDHSNMTILRDFLAKETIITDLSRIDDNKVLDQLAWRMTTGQIKISLSTVFIYSGGTKKSPSKSDAKEESVDRTDTMFSEKIAKKTEQAPNTPATDKSKYSDQREKNKSGIDNAFPKLNDEILSPEGAKKSPSKSDAKEESVSRTDTVFSEKIVKKKEQTPNTPIMDKSKYPDQIKKYKSILDNAFPKINDEYEVLSPETGDYNCIAHTLGKKNEWVNPKTGSKADPLSEMDKIYAEQGYKRSSSMDFSHKTGKQKVTVYAIKNPDGSIKNITHGAIQDNYGTWESKLGGGPLIRHKTPNALNGPVYGEPVAVYEK